MKPSIIVFLVLGVFLALAIFSKINLNTTSENIKNDPSRLVDINQLNTEPPLAKNVLASDLVAQLRKNMQQENQSVSEVGVKFYEPTK